MGLRGLGFGEFSRGSMGLGSRVWVSLVGKCGTKWVQWVYEVLGLVSLVGLGFRI